MNYKKFISIVITLALVIQPASFAMHHGVDVQTSPQLIKPIDTQTSPQLIKPVDVQTSPQLIRPIDTNNQQILPIRPEPISRDQLKDEFKDSRDQLKDELKDNRDQLKDELKDSRDQLKDELKKKKQIIQGFGRNEVKQQLKLKKAPQILRLKKHLQEDQKDNNLRDKFETEIENITNQDDLIILKKQKLREVIQKAKPRFRQIHNKKPEVFKKKKEHLRKEGQLKAVKATLGHKIQLTVLGLEAGIPASFYSDSEKVKLLGMRNLTSSDRISSRVGASIDFATEETKDVTLVFELHPSSTEMKFTLQGEPVKTSIRELIEGPKKFKLEGAKELKLSYLTNRKILRTVGDYKFENKDNQVGQRLERVRAKAQQHKECTQLRSDLKNMEFDGFENRAENLFKLLEQSPGPVACKAGLNKIPQIKEELRQLRFKAKKITYKDVAEGWFKTHVERISKRKAFGKVLFQGYKNAQGQLTGEFGPNNQIKLGELLKVSLITAGIEPNTEISDSTIDQNHWAKGFAQSAFDSNLSVASNLSDLNRSVTRGQALQTFAEALMIIDPLNPNANDSQCDFEAMKDSFADFDPEHPQTLAACLFVQDGIIKGSQGYLKLDSATNRGEIAKILNNILDKYVDVEEIVLQLPSGSQGNTVIQHPLEDETQNQPVIEADDNNDGQVESQDNNNNNSTEASSND